MFARLTGREIELVDIDRIVVVEIHVKGAFINPLDSNVAGVYILEVDPSVPTEQIAYAALDAFHFTVGIEAMDAFEFIVIMDGAELETDPAYVTVECSQDAVVVGKVL